MIVHDEDGQVQDRLGRNSIPQQEGALAGWLII
jgi:hypothetical protein